MTELKPCPFCGHKAVLMGKRVFYVMCGWYMCNARTDKYAKPKFAKDAWNMRAKDEQLRARFISELVTKEDWKGEPKQYYQPNSCSNCHNALSGEEKYCPHCGAKMDGKENDK